MSNEEKIIRNLFYGSWFLFLDFPDGCNTTFQNFQGGSFVVFIIPELPSKSNIVST